MRIEDPNSARSTASGLDRTRSSEPVDGLDSRKRSEAAAASGGDEVRLSVAAQVAHQEEVRSAEAARRLERLSAAVENGSYEVDAEALSRSLVDAALGGF